MAVDPQDLERATDLAKMGQIDEAIMLLTRLHEMEADHPDVLYLLGACHYKKGNNLKARECWEKSLQVDPTHSKSQSMLSRIPATAAPSAAAPKSAPAKKKAVKKEGKGWILKAVIVVVLLAVAALGADLFMNPQSYPMLAGFLPGSGGETAEPAAPAPSEQPAAPAQPAGPPLDVAINGRWHFKFEGNPALLTFQPNGSLVVEIDRGGGIKIRMEGSFTVSGDTISVRVNVPNPTGVPQEEQVTLYNAHFVGDDLVFNYDAPDGPETRAYKQ
jgi:hypothetical protein